MLYSLVFALIYFAVLSIIIIFDMKNRKIKKNLRKIIQRHEDEAKEKIKNLEEEISKIKKEWK